jgi:hypothetical protein
MIKQLFEGIQAAKDFTPKTSTGNRSEFPTVSTGVDNKPAFDDTPGPAGAKPTEGFTSALSLLGGPTGTMISAIAPLATTLLDRLGDRRNPNFYEQFGEDALNSNSLSMQSAGGTRDAQIRQNQLSMAGQRNANRGRSRSVNTLNVLDAASTASGREQNMAAQNQYFGNMSRLFTERAGLQNQRDRMKMQGAETAFTNDTADRDNFWTQLSTSLQSLGMGMEQSELMRNKRRVASQIDISKVLGLDFLKNG